MIEVCPTAILIAALIIILISILGPKLKAEVSREDILAELGTWTKIEKVYEALVKKRRGVILIPEFNQMIEKMEDEGLIISRKLFTGPRQTQAGIVNTITEIKKADNNESVTHAN